MMATQLPLPPFQRHSATSRAAAIAVMPTAGTKKHLVLSYIAVTGGCTDEEGQEGLRMSGNTYRPRRVDLTYEGIVIDSGITRPTQSGQQAVVWKINSELEVTAKD